MNFTEAKSTQRARAWERELLSASFSLKETTIVEYSWRKDNPREMDAIGFQFRPHSMETQPEIYGKE